MKTAYIISQATGERIGTWEKENFTQEDFDQIATNTADDAGNPCQLVVIE